MNLWEQFEADEDMEKSGIWLEVGETDDHLPIRFLIARAGVSNPKYMKVLQAKMKPIQRLLENDLLEAKASVDVMKKVFSEAIVLNWENVMDRDGKPMPFSKENCLMLFNKLPDLFAHIQAEASKLANFRKVVLQAEGKNS